MSIKVIDFFAKGKLSLNKVKTLLMSEASFCIIVEANGTVRKLSTVISKKFHYNKLKNYADVKTNKVHEYNVLVDFLIHSKSKIKRKWNLSEKEYQSLIRGLEACLIGKYSNHNIFKKALLLGSNALKKVIDTLKRKFRSRNN